MTGTGAPGPSRMLGRAREGTTSRALGTLPHDRTADARKKRRRTRGDARRERCGGTKREVERWKRGEEEGGGTRRGERGEGKERKKKRKGGAAHIASPPTPHCTSTYRAPPTPLRRSRPQRTSPRPQIRRHAHLPPRSSGTTPTSPRVRARKHDAPAA
ncbi:hypothetical protein DFH09DRAFT_1225268 [Mycena vulgaris]|nr:hypothetical protein DFH09DRAFT_1225268 [Mycena vulgaris]